MRELRDDGLTTLSFDGVPIDLLRPILPVYAHVLDHAVDSQIFGRTVPVSSAEGLILMKLLSLRPQDESDIRDLLAAYRDQLDLDFIRNELSAICDRDDPRWTTFEQLVQTTMSDRE